MRSTPSLALALGLVLVAFAPLGAQDPAGARAQALLERQEHVHGAILLRLARAGATTRTGVGEAEPGLESDLVARLTTAVVAEEDDADLAAEAAAGYAALGERAAAVLARGNAFRREVVGILSDPDVVDRKAALSQAVAAYRSRPELALPDVPKDMDVLYDHPFTFAFRSTYPDLDGLVWAGHWYALAVTEPLTDLPVGAERDAGLDTVAHRYHAKLSGGDPPQSFPSQIPLAPAIAPGFIFLSPQAAMIWDNLSLLEEVLADILVSPAATDVPRAIDDAVDYFLDPALRTTDRGRWESMALQHGIFFQGGYPLDVMTKSELNGDGHAAHMRGGGGPILMPMPN